MTSRSFAISTESSRNQQKSSNISDTELGILLVRYAVVTAVWLFDPVLNVRTVLSSFAFSRPRGLQVLSHFRRRFRRSCRSSSARSSATRWCSASSHSAAISVFSSTSSDGVPLFPTCAHGVGCHRRAVALVARTIIFGVQFAMGGGGACACGLILFGR